VETAERYTSVITGLIPKPYKLGIKILVKMFAICLHGSGHPSHQPARDCVVLVMETAPKSWPQKVNDVKRRGKGVCLLFAGPWSRPLRLTSKLGFVVYLASILCKPKGSWVPFWNYLFGACLHISMLPCVVCRLKCYLVWCLHGLKDKTALPTRVWVMCLFGSGRWVWNMKINARPRGKRKKAKADEKKSACN
jgi:hypothetical protein